MLFKDQGYGIESIRRQNKPIQNNLSCLLDQWRVSLGHSENEAENKDLRDNIIELMQKKMGSLEHRIWELQNRHLTICKVMHAEIKKRDEGNELLRKDNTRLNEELKDCLDDVKKIMKCYGQKQEEKDHKKKVINNKENVLDDDKKKIKGRRFLTYQSSKLEKNRHKAVTYYTQKQIEIGVPSQINKPKGIITQYYFKQLGNENKTKTQDVVHFKKMRRMEQVLSDR